MGLCISQLAGLRHAGCQSLGSRTTTSTSSSRRKATKQFCTCAGSRCAAVPRGPCLRAWLAPCAVPHSRGTESERPRCACLCLRGCPQMLEHGNTEMRDHVDLPDEGGVARIPLNRRIRFVSLVPPSLAPLIRSTGHQNIHPPAGVPACRVHRPSCPALVFVCMPACLPALLLAGLFRCLPASWSIGPPVDRLAGRSLLRPLCQAAALSAFCAVVRRSVCLPVQHSLDCG